LNWWILTWPIGSSSGHWHESEIEVESYGMCLRSDAWRDALVLLAKDYIGCGYLPTVLMFAIVEI